MKSKAIRTYNLPLEREIDITVDAKPYFLILLSTFIGFCLAIINNVAVMGMAMIALGFFAMMLLPRRVLLEFSSDYVVLYNKVNHNDCYMIYYSDIVNWSYLKRVYNDELCFELEDGSSEVVECFGPRRIEKILNIYAPGKKKKAGRRNENRRT